MVKIDVDNLSRHIAEDEQRQGFQASERADSAVVGGDCLSSRAIVGVSSITGTPPEKKTLKILFVYPRYPETFWGFKHALKFVSKKAAFPPLGLLTVAALLPSEWHKKLIDLNTGNLEGKDIAWADYVFVSAMDIQRASALEVIGRCVQLGTKEWLEARYSPPARKTSREWTIW